MSLADELRERVAADQAARHATDSLVENGKVVEMNPLADELILAVTRVDHENAVWLHGMLDTLGRPESQQASHDAWLLAQHADHHVTLQRRCLDAMRQAGAEASLIAYLTDRVLLNEGQPQIYGTQLV